MLNKKYIFTNHICKLCNGRILECVEGNGMTPGGNHQRICSCCGEIAYDDKTLCWCSFHYRDSNIHPFICLPLSIIEEYPQIKLLFVSHGNSLKQQVGVVSKDSYLKLLEEIRKTN